MIKTTYQKPELRDANDNIIQQGAFGKNTALANSTNDGWIDYVANDLEALYDAQTAAGNAITTGTLTVSGKTTTGTLDAGDTTVSGSITTTGLTVTGATSVPTANEGDSSKTIANTEFVTAKAGNYLPLSGGTLTGVVNGVTPTAGDNSKKLATTEFVNAKAGNYLPLSGGTMTGSIQYVNNGKVFAIGNTNTGYIDLGWNWGRKEGAILTLRNTDYPSSPGEFMLFARNANNNSTLTGKPDGSLTWNGQPLLPVGIVQAFAGSTIPAGWLLCDGSAVSRTTYASLYACIGTTYGSGDGSTTFNLPNLVDKFVEGSATAGTVKSAGLPNITGSIGGGIGSGGPAGHGSGTGFLRDIMINGCFQPSAKAYGSESGSGGVTLPSGYPVLTANLDASRSSSVYGKSTTVQPPALTMRYIIKY